MDIGLSARFVEVSARRIKQRFFIFIEALLDKKIIIEAQTDISYRYADIVSASRYNIGMPTCLPAGRDSNSD